MTAKKRKATPRRTLTAVELEMMNVIWRLGPCTVAQVRDALPPGRALAYTSVSTMIRILEQKGFVSSEKVGRGHMYCAAMSKPEFQSVSLSQLLDDVFDKAPSLLVQRLLDSEYLDAEEIERIRALLRKKEH